MIGSRTPHMWFVSPTQSMVLFVGLQFLTQLSSNCLIFELQFQMREPQMCQIVCKITPNDKEAKELKEKIEDEYRVNM